MKEQMKILARLPRTRMPQVQQVVGKGEENGKGLDDKICSLMGPIVTNASSESNRKAMTFGHAVCSSTAPSALENLSTLPWKMSSAVAPLRAAAAAAASVVVTQGPITRNIR